jgi:alpha-mannosidase
LLNDTKYGHNVSEGLIRLTLLRASYDPDPLPEVGECDIAFSLVPHTGAWSPSVATRCGYEFNHPVSVVATDLHEGSLPATRGFVSVDPPNVIVSGLKKAEDSDALIVRLYEVEGKQTRARVKLNRALAAAGSQAVETDLLERPLENNSAKMEGDTLTVAIPAYGITTVKVGD